MKRLVTITAVSIILGAIVSYSAGKGASAAGTWKLDVTKSKYSGAPSPKSATRTITASGDGEEATYKEVASDGAEAGYSYSATYDNKDAPLTGTGKSSWREDLVGGADTISIRRSGSDSYAASLKKSGLIVMTMRIVISKDGNTLTITSNGADAKGQPTNIVQVWDRH